MATKQPIAGIMTLRDFLASTSGLTLEEQRLIVDQALDLVTEVHVHLPLKRAMYAIDPEQSLRLVQRKLDSATAPMNERLFHNLMIGVFVSLRDLHTNYILPEYFASYVAFLPFYLEEYWEGDKRRYAVSRLMEEFGLDPDFKQGAAVQYWNGVPMELAVEINAEKNAGSNAAARHARGLDNMTLRPMDMSLPPDEEWVVVGYQVDGKDKETRISWQVYKPDPQGRAPTPAQPGSASRAVGMDYMTEAVRRTKVQLFHSEVAARSRALNSAGAYGSAENAAGIDLTATSTMPDILKFRAVATPHGKIGYLRVYSFAPPDDGTDTGMFVQAFFAEVVRILGLLPQNGLILDVRGNGGGIIIAGERLLQLFTPNSITPEPFSFINTPTTRILVDKYVDLKVWAPSIEQAVETGGTYSQGFALTSDDEANSTGQIYQGPVVLITNALIYSTTDIFTAGFKDHGIGLILGTDPNTGAGGANVWDYIDLRESLPDLFKKLPKGTSMRVAIRRSTRVGAMSGMPLEDLGVIPDAVHKMTRNDVFQDNVDLIADAAARLQTKKRYSLAGAMGAGGLTIQSQGVTRVDVYVNNRPALSVNVKDGATQTALAPTAGSAVLLQGFDGEQLSVSRKV